MLLRQEYERKSEELKNTYEKKMKSVSFLIFLDHVMSCEVMFISHVINMFSHVMSCYGGCDDVTCHNMDILLCDPCHTISYSIYLSYDPRFVMNMMKFVKKKLLV